MIRLVIISRNRLLREGLAFALHEQGNAAVVGDFAEASEVLGARERLHVNVPDVTIMDLSLQGESALGELRQIRETFPDIKMLVIGLAETESNVLACIETGAAGYVSQCFAGNIGA